MRGEWWVAVKDVLKHYWVGTKLLWMEVKIASKYVGKAVRGKTLSRRERMQLTRTTADIFRMVPMLIFLVIPFCLNKHAMNGKTYLKGESL